MSEQKHSKSLLMIISGPTGSGKTTLCDRMLAGFPNTVSRVITCTTRKPRKNEVDGRDYHFFTESTFKEHIQSENFYEHALVYSDYYGTLKSEILSKLQKDQEDLLLNIDVQGAATILKKAAENPFLMERLVTVFIMPPSLEELRRRLFSRGENTAVDIERRITIAAKEIKHQSFFKHTIYSNSREEDFEALQNIYHIEKENLKNSLHLF